MLKIDKNIIIGILIIAILVFVGIIGWVLFQKGKPLAEEISPLPSQEEIIKKQLETPNESPQVVPEKEIEKQLQELNKKEQPLSGEEIKKQLEELLK